MRIDDISNTGTDTMGGGRGGVKFQEKNHGFMGIDFHHTDNSDHEFRIIFALRRHQSLFEAEKWGSRFLLFQKFKKKLRY